MHASAHPLSALPVPPGGHHRFGLPACAAAATVAALLTGAATWSLHGAQPGAVAPQSVHAAEPQCARTAAAAARPAPSDDALDSLRHAAKWGHADASVMLVGALLDRYDAGAGTPALFEAMQWLDRDLHTAPMLESGLVQRVALGACRSDPLLQWHWLCEEGE